jgi:hypothetical protein
MNTDRYPEPQVNAYHDALRAAIERVDNMSATLVNGCEHLGQVETTARE